MYPYNPYFNQPQPPLHYYPYNPNYAVHSYPLYRTFPPVNPNQFMSSAKAMQTLMKDASTVLTKMAESKQFSLELMSAAQQSQMTKVNAMIKSTGVKSTPKVSYNPDGINLIFETKANNMNCCQLSLNLRWM